MKNGVKWEDLTSAERMGARFLPLDAWLPVSPSGVISKKGIQNKIICQLTQ